MQRKVRRVWSPTSSELPVHVATRSSFFSLHVPLLPDTHALFIAEMVSFWPFKVRISCTSSLLPSHTNTQIRVTTRHRQRHSNSCCLPSRPRSTKRVPATIVYTSNNVATKCYGLYTPHLPTSSLPPSSSWSPVYPIALLSSTLVWPRHPSSSML